MTNEMIGWGIAILGAIVLFWAWWPKDNKKEEAKLDPVKPEPAPVKEEAPVATKKATKKAAAPKKAAPAKKAPAAKKATPAKKAKRK